MANYEVLSHAAIVYLTGLIRDLASVSEGIDDINLRSDGTFSSVMIDTLIKKCLEDANEYTEKLVANLSRLELKLVTNESEITQPNILYLFKPDGATSYNQYVVIEGNKVLLGTCDIDMAQYLKIADASKTYCTKTELKAVTDKIGTTTLTTTAQTLTGSIEEVKEIAEQGALLTVTKTQYDQLVAGQTVNIDGKDYTYDNNTYYVVKDDSDTIVTTSTINSSSTDSEVPTAKAVNDLLQTEGSGNLTIPLNEDLNNLIYNRTRVWMNSQTVEIATFTNMPSGRYTECAVIFIPYENAIGDYGEQIFVGNNDRIFIRNKVRTTWTAWRKVCTAATDNVVKGSVTLNSGYSGSVTYSVINGWFSVRIDDLKVPSSATTGGSILSNTTLLPARINDGVVWGSITSAGSDGTSILVHVSNTGQLNHYTADATKKYCGQYVYPVG